MRADERVADLMDTRAASIEKAIDFDAYVKNIRAPGRHG